uniref:pyridoxal kinase n=1 Tax=Anser cygnoides TaxID=8845 RepID=A0A8B9DQ36_ANSCY
MEPERECRVLSIQSHVVRGYVGNKAATFPLQVSEPRRSSSSSPSSSSSSAGAVLWVSHAGMGSWAWWPVTRARRRKESPL